MKIFTWIIGFLVLFLIAYNIWAASGKSYTAYKTDGLFTGAVNSQGEDAGKGNVIGVQPYFVPFNFCDEQHFMQALRPYFETAKSAGFLKPNSIILFPENTGTWLVTANEKTAVYRADSFQQALSIIINSNIFTFVRHLLSAKAADKISQALFLAKAGSMAKMYEAVFSSLAKEYRVTIVAGSVLLPNPSVNTAGKIELKKGTLFNASFVFGPDGKIIAQPVLKQSINNEEKQFINASDNKKNPTVQTPAGTLSVLLSTDSWRRQTYSITPDIMLVAASDDPTTSWSAPWKGFEQSGFDTSGNGGITVGEAWMKYGLGNNRNTSARNSMYVFFSGKLWEKEFRGRLITRQKDSIKVHEPAPAGGRILNLWLE